MGNARGRAGTAVIRKGVPIALAFVSVASGASAQPRSIQLSGHVERGQEFHAPISDTLEFVLRPNTQDPGAIEGWTIAVTPKAPHPSECEDFVWVVTPPYRSYNPRYLDTSYGTTALEAVTNSPREFSFVLTCADYQLEAARVERVLWPYRFSDEEVRDAEARLGTEQGGRGRLSIREYHISPAPRSAGGVTLGVIDWIRFDLEIMLGAPAADFTAPSFDTLRASDTIAAAGLPAAEWAQVRDSLERLAFDTPDSWESEIRLRRVPYGGAELLVAQGTDRLCGGTGNCQLVVFQRQEGKWTASFDGDDAPIADGFAFVDRSGSDRPDFVVRAHVSAGASRITLYRFMDGRYKATQCYEQQDGSGNRPVTCESAGRR